MKGFFRDSKMLRYILFVTVLVAFTGCAFFKSFRSGGEITVEKPPYFHSFSKISIGGANVGHLPIVLDRRAVDPTSQNISKALLEKMSSFFTAAGWTSKLEAINLPIDAAPDLFFGNPAMFGSPVGSSKYEEDKVHPPMVLFYRNASEKWKTELAKVAAAGEVDYVLFTTIGVSEYFVRQTNLLGKKELSLGTNYNVPVKWLTSLEDPVEVLHITGALLDKTGKILRVGAEGIIAAKTASVLESALDLRNVISEEEINRVMNDVRREDLPDKPLAYQVALQNLVANLLQRSDLVVR